MGLAWVSYERGFAAAEQNNPQKAIELYQTAVGLDSGKALYHSALAMAYSQSFEKAGELTQSLEAIREYERAMVLNPLDGRLPGQLARVYAMVAEASGAGQRDPRESDDRTLYRRRALAAYGQGLRLQPFNPFYRLEAARLHAMLGQHDRAVALVREAVELEPNFLAGRAWLVRRHVKTGNLEAARQEYADLLARRARYATWPKDGYDTRLLAADVEGLTALLRKSGATS
jgi:tetratricopeptide (TPR) repeat protein